jgi:uncharacterized membrane protein
MTSPSDSFLLRNRYLVHLFARPRLLICIALGIASALLLPAHWRAATRILIGWNLATWLYIVLVGLLMRKATPTSIRRRALMTDESRFVVLTLATLAAIVSLAAIFVQLGNVKDAVGLAKAMHLGLACATILSSWIFIHLMFAQHYAHEFFLERDAEKLLPEDERGGLRFPGSRKPQFVDFLYFSFVIGCASQTADVETTSAEMRVITLLHGVISFFFNTTVLALTINIAAGLI